MRTALAHTLAAAHMFVAEQVGCKEQGMPNDRRRMGELAGHDANLPIRAIALDGAKGRVTHPYSETIVTAT